MVHINGRAPAEAVAEPGAVRPGSGTATQVEVLDLLADRNETEGRTIVAVLHDLNRACRYAVNRACRYAHHLVPMADGAVVAQGRPADVVVTRQIVREVFGVEVVGVEVVGVEVVVVPDQVTSTSLVLPLARAARRTARTDPAPVVPQAGGEPS